MAYRDVLFAPLTSIFVLRGLDAAVVDAAPRALAAVVRGRRGASRRWPGSALVPRAVRDEWIGALVLGSVHRAPASLDDAELIAAADAAGLSGLPVALTIAGSRCAVVTAHAVFDGTGSLALIHDLLDAASGVPLTPEPATARTPVLQALRHVRLADLRMFVAARRNRAPGVPATPAATATSSAFTLRTEDLALIRRYRERGRVGRATLHSRLASLIVAALKEISISDLDVPVWMTTDLRHFVDGPVDGNFIGREQVGTLLGDDWAPGALAERLVRLKGPGQALSLVWSSTGWLLRSALGRRPHAGEEVVLTLASTRRSLPVHVGTVTAASIGGSPTFAFAWQTRTAVYVSVYNTSGRFDLCRFEEAFRSIVRERAAESE